MLIPIKDIISARFVSMDSWIAWKLYILVCSKTKGGSDNSSRNEWSRTIVFLILQRYTRWAGLLFAWPWSLKLLVCLLQLKKQEECHSQILQQQLVCHRKNVVSYCIFDLFVFCSFELRPKRSSWFPSNIEFIASTL